MKKKCSKTCLYCEMPLSSRHEHDHFPVPDRHGGTAVWCVCINCHDLKDRIPLDKWDAEVAHQAFEGLWRRAEPIERIRLAKMYAITCDAAQGLER